MPKSTSEKEDVALTENGGSDTGCTGRIKRWANMRCEIFTEWLTNFPQVFWLGKSLLNSLGKC